MRFIDRKAWPLLRFYVSQCALATCTLFIVLLILTTQDAIVMVSIGASTFIVFAMPTYVTARPGNVIIGHLIGMLCGMACSLIPTLNPYTSAFQYALAVGLSMFIMSVTDTEHPPASGTALGMAIEGVDWPMAGSLIVSVCALCLIHWSLRKYLKSMV